MTAQRSLGRARPEETAGLQIVGDRSRDEILALMTFETDAKGDATYFSGAWSCYTGMRLPQCGGAGWMTAVHPDDLSRSSQVWACALNTGDPCEIRLRLVDTDGRHRWFQVRAVSRRDPQGVVNQWYGVAFDVHDLVASQESQQERETRLRLALAAGEMGMWDIELSTGLVQWDGRQYELFGRTPDLPQPTFEEFYQYVHPDDVSRVRRAAESSLRTGRFREAFRILRTDGTVRWLVGEGLIVNDASGRPCRMVGINHEVTATYHEQAALRDRDQRYQLVLRAGRMGTWDADLVTGLTRWDQKEYALLGLREGEVQPSVEEFYRHVHPDDLPAVQASVQTALASRSDLICEFRVLWPDGTVRWLAARGLLYTDEQGRVQRMVGVNYDITEQKERELQLCEMTAQLEQRVRERTAELERSQSRLRTLATQLNLAEQRERKRLADDLHDHLQQLLVFCKFKLSRSKSLEGAGPAAQTIREVDEAVTAALKYSRTLLAELSPPVLRHHGLLAGLRWLAESMRQHHMRVTVAAPGALSLVLPEDQSLLVFQSVRELLINAWKYAGTVDVRIAVEEQENGINIRVEDDGRGFDLAAAAAADNSSPLSSKFGLFSIRERMTALGGRFDMKSAPGRGTQTLLSLPCGKAARLASPGTNGATPVLTRRAITAAAGKLPTDVNTE